MCMSKEPFCSFDKNTFKCLVTHYSYYNDIT